MLIRRICEGIICLHAVRIVKIPHRLSVFVLLCLSLLMIMMTTTTMSASYPPCVNVRSRTFSRRLVTSPVSTTMDALDCRGGSVGNENRKSASSKEGTEKESRSNGEDDDYGESDMETHSVIPLSIGSLFRLSNEIKVQAAAAEGPSEEGPISPHNKGRGGALAVVKAPPVAESTSRTTGFFGVFDTSSVKPLSSRLIQDEESKTTPVVTVEEENNERTNTASTATKSTSTHTKTQNMWWNNAWQQQFPNGEIIEEIEVMAQDASGEASVKPTENKKEEEIIEDEEESFDELEGLLKAEKEERKKHKTEPNSSPVQVEEVPAESKDVSSQSGEGDIAILPFPEEVASQESIIVPPSSSENLAATKRRYKPASVYESSGYWGAIDNVLSVGLASSHPSLRLSRHLRVVRKQVAHITGLHGAISGKSRKLSGPHSAPIEEEDDEHMGMLRRRLAAIDRARGNLGLSDTDGRKKGIFGRFLNKDGESLRDEDIILQQERSKAEAKARRKRVQEIDEQIVQGQKRLLQLATEKDILQRRPNPLWNYTTTVEELDQARRLTTENGTAEATMESVDPLRHFNFPPPDLVDEYLTMLFATGRLVKLNHTDLWKGAVDEDDDEDEDEWLSSPMKVNGDAQKKKDGNGDAGSRWLRNGLGEKLGESVETAAYRAVGRSVMSFLSKLISSIHGISVMGHTDIRLFTEQAPSLPPVAGIIPGAMGSSSYAQGAFENVLRRGERKSKKRRKRRDDSFIQRDAVVETLLSQSQIAMPLLKIFPLAWQRAMLGNVVTLVTATMMDFFEGLEFQILGHRLSFSFVPITEEDMMRHWASSANDVFSRRHRNAARFEAAVLATAQDVAENLKFLDRWHERLLGGDALKTQLSNLVARLVLTLVDETLSGAKMDLWTTHAGGPRLIAGLEYRTEPIKQ